MQYRVQLLGEDDDPVGVEWIEAEDDQTAIAGAGAIAFERQRNIDLWARSRQLMVIRAADMLARLPEVGDAAK